MNQRFQQNYTHIIGWLFVAPFLIAFLVFAIYPLFYSLYLSLTDFSGFGKMNLVWFQNFKDLARDSIFKKAVFNTLYIWLTCFFFQVLIALVLSGIVTYSRIRGKQLWISLFFFPNLVSAAVMAMLFTVFFSKEVGVINVFLKDIGVINESIIFLGNKWRARAIISLIIWIQYYGVFVIYLSTAIRSISKDIYDSALVDGCSGWKAFSQITLPLLRPILYFIFITSVVGGMQIFEQPYLLTVRSGGPSNSTTTLMMYVYRQAFEYQRLGYAAAIAFCTLIIIIAGTSAVSLWNRHLKNKYI